VDWFYNCPYPLTPSVHSKLLFIQQTDWFYNCPYPLTPSVHSKLLFIQQTLAPIKPYSIHVPNFPDPSLPTSSWPKHGKQIAQKKFGNEYFSSKGRRIQGLFLKWSPNPCEPRTQTKDKTICSSSVIKMESKPKPMWAQHTNSQYACSPVYANFLIY
jgi:hypothetical protein